MPSTLARTPAFPLSRLLPEPPLYGPGPGPGLGLGGKYIPQMELGGSSGRPRVVSGGSRGLGDLLNHVGPRREFQYGDHEHDHDHGHDQHYTQRRERVLSPRLRAGQGYQTNDHTGLPSPDNSPPLLPVSQPRPRSRSRSPARVQKMEGGREYVFSHRVEGADRGVYSAPVRASEEFTPRPGSSGDRNHTTVKAETPNPDSPTSENKPQKKRTRLNPEQSGLLKKVWRETCFPSTERRGWLADQTGLSVRQVQVWFQVSPDRYSTNQVEGMQELMTTGNPIRINVRNNGMKSMKRARRFPPMRLIPCRGLGWHSMDRSLLGIYRTRFITLRGGAVWDLICREGRGERAGRDRERRPVWEDQGRGMWIEGWVRKVEVGRARALGPGRARGKAKIRLPEDGEVGLSSYRPSGRCIRVRPPCNARSGIKFHHHHHLLLLLSRFLALKTLITPPKGTRGKGKKIRSNARGRARCTARPHPCFRRARRERKEGRCISTPGCLLSGNWD